MKRVLFLSAVVLALTARPASAASILITTDGSFTVSWLNTVTNPDLSGGARFVISNFTPTGFDLTIDQITNSTGTAPDINARLVSFGFGLTPDLTSVSNVVDGSVFDWGFSNFPVFGSVDVCGFSGSNCAGGGGGGLAAGESMPGSMSIHFNGNFTNGVTFSPIPAKFQTSAGSFEFDACIGEACIPNVSLQAVPEPASMVLLATGLLFTASRLKRARRT